MTRSSRGSSKRKIGIVLLTLALAGGSWKLVTSSRAGKGTQDRGIGLVKRADLVQRVTVAGKVIPRKTTLITPPYNGYVNRLHVGVGQRIASNAPVVALTQSLNASAEEVFPLRSPFAGTVVQVMKSEGEYVEAGKQDNYIARIDDLNQLFVSGEVPEIDIVKVKLGQEVVIRVAPIPQRTYKGVIREISISSKLKGEYSRTGDRVDFPVRIEILDKDDAVRPGMSASVDIIANKREKVLTLAHEYIEKGTDGYYVRREDGSKQKIEIGLQNEEATEILSGLKEGDRIRQVDFFTDAQP